MIITDKFPLRYTLDKVWKSALFFVLFSLGIFFIGLYIELPKIPSTIPAFLGTAISLVLSFKLGQSYNRWWEARKIWGAIVNDSRTLATQVISFSGMNHSLTKPFVYRQIAFCYSLGQSLRKENPSANLESILSDSEMSFIQKQDNKPFALLQRHSQDVKQLHESGIINDYQQIQLDDTILRLCASMGKAERIKNTVFPASYRVYLHFFILIFLGVLTVSLAEIQGAWEVVLLGLIALPFLLLEKTAYYLQDPFEGMPTDTPVTAIARTIEINLRQALGESEVPPSLQPTDFYLL